MAEQKPAYYKETLNALEKLKALCRKREKITVHNKKKVNK